ncbi:uncharacterized protein DSM5745_09076 [Aspergillus mulundensis]|uniref:Aminoglycoside phosphotransferase domain-containing protein n=1 Tax=Aspergillus mulundensis TaxID=1810919 RepID=A0A3D8QZW7_9EURO|nr:hypothetical protein DSM5745_09076 [Aspergillus mulundensis]RDW67210.1 hypothetical protein DSM5745_09076 [Aspergillus mulundensis]
MACPASPPIEQSISKWSTTSYRMGTRFLCRRVASDGSEDTIARWKDADGTLGLFEHDGSISTNEQPCNDLVYQAGTSSAVWEIGSEAICKVKTWTPGMEMESDTLAFVKAKASHIPVPEVIYAWLDKKLRRTYLILRRIQGSTLQHAWGSLTPNQQDTVADIVAQYCFDLTRATSSRLESARGCGVLEPFLHVPAKESHPSWEPRLLGPMSAESFIQYLRRRSDLQPPPVNEFYFYHADLSPTNIIVSESGMVLGILDWESAGYYPGFWVSLKPYMSRGFLLCTEDSRYAWADALIEKLSDKGFTLKQEHIDWYKSLKREYFDIQDFLASN